MSEEREEFPESRPSLFDDAELLEAVQDVFGADALKLLQEDETAGNDSEGTSVAAALQEAWDAEAERRRCETPAVGERQVVVLIGPYRIGIPLAQVLEVQPRPPVTSLPGVADWIRGVWNRRGEVTALSDLRRLFGLSGVAASRPQRVVVVRDTSGTRVTSLLVDGVLGMRPVAARQDGPPGEDIPDQMARFVGEPAVADGAIVWPLNVEALFAESPLADATAR